MGGGEPTARPRKVLLPRAAAAVLGSRPPRCREEERGGEREGRQTLGFGFGREKGFKQRRNSYFKQKIEWRRDSIGGRDSELNKQKTDEGKSGRRSSASRTCSGHKDERQRAIRRRR